MVLALKEKKTKSKSLCNKFYIIFYFLLINRRRLYNIKIGALITQKETLFIYTYILHL